MLPNVYHVSNLQHTEPCCHFPVCDLVSCYLPEVPRCEDGQTVVLKNPGECQPIHECGKSLIHSLWCSGPTGKHTHSHETERMLTQPYSPLFLSQCAKRKSVLFKLPPIVHHIAICRWERQSAATCLNVTAAAKTPPTPVPLGSSRPPLPTIVGAQKPTACQTRWVYFWIQIWVQYVCCLSCKLYVLCVSRCVWLVEWFTQWGVNGSKVVRSASAPSCRTKTRLSMLHSANRLFVTGPVLWWDSQRHQRRIFSLCF